MLLSGQILPAMFLVITGYLGCDPVLAVVMITIAVGSSGFVMSGYGVNHLDIAPPFAGIYHGVFLLSVVTSVHIIN